jgi:hypothetical protein
MILREDQNHHNKNESSPYFELLNTTLITCGDYAVILNSDPSFSSFHQ